jgi:hypothetical protein
VGISGYWLFNGIWYQVKQKVVSKITCDSPTRHKARRAGEAEKNMKEKKQYIALFRDLVLAVFASDRVREKGKQMLSETYVDRKNSNFGKV